MYITHYTCYTFRSWCHTFGLTLTIVLAISFVREEDLLNIVIFHALTEMLIIFKFFLTFVVCTLLSDILMSIYL